MPRRRLLQSAGAMVSIGLAARPAAAADDVLAARDFAQAIGLLGGAPRKSARVTLSAPTVAEDGAFVPVTVGSSLPDTRELLLLVDGNPQPVAAHFIFPAGTEPFVATRIRMAGNGTVYAVVRSGGAWHAAACAVEVTVGGCG